MYMDRTTILLPPDLKIRAEKAARQKGISFGELVRRGLERMIMDRPTPERDSFFSDESFFEGKVPPDASKNLDEYMYGRK